MCCKYNICRKVLPAATQPKVVSLMQDDTAEHICNKFASDLLHICLAEYQTYNFWLCKPLNAFN